MFVEHVDRYQNQILVQKLFVDLIYLIAQSQGDMNIMTLKVPSGVFGRLRRTRLIFVELSERIDDLLDALFRVSAKAMKADFSKPDTNVEAQEENK